MICVANLLYEATITKYRNAPLLMFVNPPTQINISNLISACTACLVEVRLSATSIISLLYSDHHHHHHPMLRCGSQSEYADSPACSGPRWCSGSSSSSPSPAPSSSPPSCSRGACSSSPLTGDGRPRRVGYCPPSLTFPWLPCSASISSSNGNPYSNGM